MHLLELDNFFSQIIFIELLSQYRSGPSSSSESQCESSVDESPLTQQQQQQQQQPKKQKQERE